ncbi:MAG: pentapeptide repeat-containing protein, partial [Planctomycetota bacterium]|nr:pentapeptide repeat-containing protein [Planctomycetota bacterium]
ILRSKAPRLSQFRADVPQELETIVARCLCKDPDDRYPTATDLAADCARWLIGEAINANPVSTYSGWRSSNSGDRLSWVTASIALSFVFATVLTVLVLSFNTDLSELRQEKKLAETQWTQSAERVEVLERKVSSELDNAEALKKEQRRVKGTRIAGHSLGNTQFSGANLTGMDFSGVLVKSGQFLNCEIENAVFRGAVLENCRVIDCNFSGSDFSGAKLKNIQLVDVNFTGCNFESAKWTGGTYDSKTLWPAAFDPSEYGLVKREAAFARTTPNKTPRSIYEDGRDRNAVFVSFSKELGRINQHLNAKNLDVCVTRMKNLLVNSRDTLSQESPARLNDFHKIFNLLIIALRRKRNDGAVNTLIAALPAKHQSRYKGGNERSYTAPPEACRELEIIYQLVVKGQGQRGLQRCRQLVKKYPELEPLTLAFQGWIADRLGNYQAARKYLKEFDSVLYSQSFMLDKRYPVTKALGFVTKYLNIGTALDRFDAKYDADLKTLINRAKNEDIKSFFGISRGSAVRRKGMSLWKKGMLPFVLKRERTDLLVKPVRRPGPSHPKDAEFYQSIVDKSPTYFPALVSLSEIHPHYPQRLTYCLAALNIIRITPELAENSDLDRVTTTLLKEPILTNFVRVENNASRTLDSLFQSAIQIQAYCLVQMIAERLFDRVALPNNKRRLRLYLKSLPPLNMRAQMFIQSKAKVSVRVNGIEYRRNNAQASTWVTLPIGSDLEVYAEATTEEAKGLLLIFQLVDGRVFYLSPRHYSKINTQKRSKRLTVLDYKRVKPLRLDFPICWSEENAAKDRNKSIRVKHRLEFSDFRHYYNYKWSYKKE